MSNEFEIAAESRNDAGKGASRRLRRAADMLPAIVYGGDKEPQNISLVHKDMMKTLENEAIFAHVIQLSVDGGAAEPVILKDLQRHPSKPRLLHADFQRVSANRELHVHVPLHFINEDKCVGAKAGGIIQHNMNEMHISCLPKDLPEFIEVDLAAVEVGQSVHLSEVQLPAGVSSIELSHGPEHDLPVAAVVAPKGGLTTEAEEGDE